MIYQTKKITSVKQFVDEITDLRKERPADNAQQWFFRGQKNSNWDVRPNIFRGDELATEHLLIDKAQRQNPIEFRDCTSKFEILTKLQHYGLGTRLLDVTLNPLVALYFATEPFGEYIKNKNGQFSYKGNDGVVYYRFVMGCALNDLQMRIALTIPFIDFGKSMSLEIFCNRLKDDDIITVSEYNRLIADNYDLTIKHIQTNSFVISANSNVRLIQQRGAFLIAPSINVKSSTDISKSILSKAKSNLENEFEGNYIVPEKNKDEIREELDFFNVNEATLFPELEHQMHYLKNQAKAPVGAVEDYSQYIRRTVYPNKLPGAYAAIKTFADILAILNLSIPSTSDESRKELANSIGDETKVIDWQKKDSSISHIRRSIMNVLTETMPADIARDKANEVIYKLLE